MAHQEGRISAMTVAYAFLGGALLGVIGGILLAPRSGEETRRAIKGYAHRAEEELAEKAGEIQAELDGAIARSKEFLGEKKAMVAAVFEAGKEAFKKELVK